MGCIDHKKFETFQKLVRKERGTREMFPEESDVCRTMAERLARNIGATYDDLVALMDAPASAEMRREAEAARKAQQRRREAAEEAERWRREQEEYEREREAEREREREAKRAETQARRDRRREVIARYGKTKDDVLAPCIREKAILAAVARWRVPDAGQPRWTEAIDGWHDYWNETPSPRLVDAVMHVYPMPKTFAAACEELDYWTRRASDLEAMRIKTDGWYPPSDLDLVARLRCKLVQNLVMDELPCTTAADIYDRVLRYSGFKGRPKTDLWTSLLRDLKALAEQQLVTPEPSASVQPGNLRDRIMDALRADPSTSDRTLAGQFGCSPTTVGKARREAGLAGVKRSVHRSGQTFGMKTKAV